MADKRFLSIHDLINLPQPQWLIESLFEVNSLVMLAGPSGHYKSFLAIDWTLSMVTNRKWNGKDVVPAKVLYCLGEGKSNLLKRIQAWVHFHRLSGAEQTLLQENFRVSFDVPQLALKASVDNMLAGLTAEGFAPTVIVIDTFARSFVGLDENDAKDTGMWIEQADRLRQLGYTVIFLHHTAKNTELGLKYRGSTAIMGAMDTAFTFQKLNNSNLRQVLTCTKQKDHDEGDPIYFQSLTVRPNPQEEGSIVLQQVAKMDERFLPKHEEEEPRLSPDQLVDELLDDPNYESNRQRAAQLAVALNISDSAAYSRLDRRAKAREKSFAFAKLEGAHKSNLTLVESAG